MFLFLFFVISGSRPLVSAVFQSYREFTEVWCRPLYDGSVAVVLFSRRADQPYPIVASFSEVLLLDGIDKYGF